MDETHTGACIMLSPAQPHLSRANTDGGSHTTHKHRFSATAVGTDAPGQALSGYESEASNTRYSSVCIDYIHYLGRGGASSFCSDLLVAIAGKQLAVR